MAMALDDACAPLMINVGSDVDDDQILRKLIILVCTSADEFNVKAFILLMAERFRSLIKEIRYLRLPYNDLDKFSFRGDDAKADVIILCHSIHNRRFAITDVPDALYNTFLPHAARVVGRENVCVLVHDMSVEHIEPASKYQDTMDAFRVKQPTTFQNASLVMVGGKLGEADVELSEENVNALRDFVYEAATRPAPPPFFDHHCPSYMLGLMACLTLFLEYLRRCTEFALSLLKSLWTYIKVSCKSWTGVIVWAIIAMVLIVFIFSLVITHQSAPQTIIVPGTNTTPSVASSARVHAKLHQENDSVKFHNKTSSYNANHAPPAG